jgi:phosphomevalonate kinase
MTARTATAPGKLFLTGDYVVLRGAPALVAAVDRHARMRLETRDGPLTIVSRVEGAEVRVADVAPDGAPAGDVGAALTVARMLDVRDGHLDIDTREFLHGKEKLGLGRSAATIVAATAVWLAARGEQARSVIRTAALEANRRFQGGHGSGGDVAAAVSGGVVEVRRGDGELKTAPSRLPGGLELVVAWSGAGAHTVPLVAKFATAGTCRSLSELGTAAEAAADAAVRDDPEDFCVAVARSGTLLQMVGRDLDLPIVTPSLAALMDVAARLGIAAKPSGAGAGDCAIAFARSPAEAETLRAAWRDAGFLPLALAIEHEGVRVE